MTSIPAPSQPDPDPEEPHGAARAAAAPRPAELATLAVMDDDGEISVDSVAGLAAGVASWDSLEAHSSLSDGELVDLIGSGARLEAYAASVQRRAAAALERRADLGEKLIVARERNRDTAAGQDISTPARLRSFRVSEAASDEIAMHLGISRPAAARMIGEGQLLTGNLSVVGDALTEGTISPAKATVLVDVLREQDLPVCLAVCEDALPAAPGLTPTALERRAHTLLIQTDPAAAARRHERARDFRNLSRVRTLADGMARLTLTTTLLDATAVHTVADLAARAAKADGDQRTLDQLRADTIATLAHAALGRGSTDPGTSGSTLSSEPDQPGPSMPGSATPRRSGHPDESWPGVPEPEVPRPVAPTRTAPVTRAFTSRGARTLRIRDDLANLSPDAALPPGTAEEWARALAFTDTDTEDEPNGPGPHATDGLPPFTNAAGTAPWPPGRLTPGPELEPDGPGPHVTDGFPPFTNAVGTAPWPPGWLVPEISGYGPLDHATARRLAQQPPPWLAVVRLTDTDLCPGPGPGRGRGRGPAGRDPEGAPAAQPPAEDGYLPSAELRRAVNRIHPTCIAPTCSIPSSSCHPDHAIPYPAGRTELWNLLPLCARHHLLKTHRGHSYTRDSQTGTVTWTTATGHTYRRTSDGVTTHRSPRARPP